MKTGVMTVALMWSAVFGGETPQNLIVGIPPKMSEACKAEFNVTLNRLLQESAKGSVLSIYDARSGERLCRFVLQGRGRGPMKAAMQSLRPVQQFLKGQAQRTVDGVRSDEIRIPQFLELAAATLRGDAPTAILLFGLPYYLDGRDPACVFEGSQVPSDEHLRSSQSVFGCAGLEKQLNNVSVSLIYPSDAIWSSSRSKQAILRFWRLFCQLQGGSMFASNDANTVIDRLLAGVQQVQKEDLDSSTVLEIRDVSEPVRQTREAVDLPTARPGAKVQQKSARPAPMELGASAPVTALPAAAQVALKKIEKPKVGSLRLALIWVDPMPGQAVDLDLWVKAGEEEELYFNKKEAGKGRYLRDNRGGSVGSRDDWNSLEVVELEAIELEQAQVFVNLYRGRGPVSGLVRVIFAEEEGFDVPFEFGDLEGNEASSRNSRDQSPHWKCVDLVKRAAR